MGSYTKYLYIFTQTLKCSSIVQHQSSGRFCHIFLKQRKLERFSFNVTSYNTFSCFHTSTVFHKRRKTAEERKSARIIEYSPKSKSEIVDIWRDITVAELAEIYKRDINYIQELFLGNIKGANTVINDVKRLQEAIKRSGKRMRIIGKPKDVQEIVEKDVYPRSPAPKSDLKPRPPVVTVMGHVDHGKTTLLDALRHANVVEKEFGGITQHIGAFSVILQSGAQITFLDTPGHAAFSAMRARGANVTDIVVLVVAADDGVMEQTLESVKMAQNAKVPILVAINKIDAPHADIERTQRMLIEAGIQVEAVGGDVQAIEISALKRINLEQLTEALMLQAELLEIHADPTGPVEAVVIESHVHPHRGRLSTVIVQRGTLRKGDILVAGLIMAKVRMLRDAEGNVLDEVLPGYPAEVEGWKDLPSAGDLVLQVPSEKRARAVIKIREDKKEAEKQAEDAVAISAKMEQHHREYKEKLLLKRRLGRFRLRPEGPRKPEIKDDNSIQLNVIVKGDVDGTVEAILDTLDTYQSDICPMDLVHYGVGAINESDIELAEAFKGIIYAFNVECPNPIKQLAENAGVTIKHHNVIYKLIDDVKEEINSRLPPKPVETITGEAVVLQQFFITDGRKKVPIAGCRCTKGTLKRTATFRLIRNGQQIFQGSLLSMRYLKSEMDIIKQESECGLQLQDSSIMFEPNDVLICFESKMEPQVTDWNPGF